MNLPAVSHVNTAKGFTLIELLLTTSLLLLFGALLFPLSVSFLNAYMLDETAQGVVSTLRRAQQFSVTGKHDATYGVRFLSDTYVLYQGSSYADRIVSEDEVYPLRQSVTVSGIEEVSFAAFSGTPAVPGSISLTTHEKGIQIELLPSGVIYY